MGANLRKWALPGGAALVLVAGLVYAFWPQPVPVDMGTAERGPMIVTVDGEGRTRVKDVYTISAPVSGRVRRFTGEVGDEVVAGETVVATIQPSDPGFLDVRTQSELQAAAKGAEAARDQARAEMVQAEAAYDYAQAEYERAQKLAEKGNISESALDKARLEARLKKAAVETARAALNVQESKLQQARAALLSPESASSAGNDEACCLNVRAPETGTILRIFQESEAVVAAGAPLVEIGNPANLEIVVDLLSTDAVKVSPGDPVLIEDWGGDQTLNGRVRRIEPFGFTKISTLGIEEQRVNVIIDFTDPREVWRQLGHGFRVDTRIIIWKDENTLRVPVSTLFRVGENWSLMKVEDGRATLTTVSVGRMNNRFAQIRGGLTPGDRVILHPSDRIEDGMRVAERRL